MLSGGDFSVKRSMIPKPSKNSTIMRMKGENGTMGKGKALREKVVGIQAGKFNPSEDGSMRKFKGGAMNGKNDTLCKKRFTQVSITALGNLTTPSARLLRTAKQPTTPPPATTTTQVEAEPTYGMTVMLASEDFNYDEESSSAMSLLKAGSVLIISMSLLLLA